MLGRWLPPHERRLCKAVESIIDTRVVVSTAPSPCKHHRGFYGFLYVNVVRVGTMGLVAVDDPMIYLILQLEKRLAASEAQLGGQPYCCFGPD